VQIPAYVTFKSKIFSRREVVDSFHDQDSDRNFLKTKPAVVMYKELRK